MLSINVLMYLCLAVISTVCRYYLYSISKPNKEGSTVDLSNDVAPYQLKIDRILTNIISSCSHLQPVISERLRSVLRAKLWKQIHPLNSKGRNAVFDKWKKKILFCNPQKCDLH